MRINCLIPEKRSSCVPCWRVRDILENVWKISHFFWTWSATLLRIETSKPIVCVNAPLDINENGIFGRPFLNGNNERSSSDQKKNCIIIKQFFFDSLQLRCIVCSTRRIFSFLGLFWCFVRMPKSSLSSSLVALSHQTAAALQSCFVWTYTKKRSSSRVMWKWVENRSKERRTAIKGVNHVGSCKLSCNSIDTSAPSPRPPP